MKIGFIGLGNMGGHMAMHLLHAGHELMVYDVVAAALVPFLESGAIAASPADMAAKADILFSSVQTSDQVKNLCLGEKGIFAHAHPGLIYIDCSSIDINVTRELHEKAAKHQISMLDSPVSGGVGGAQLATLTFMVGGDAAVLEKVKPVLQTMGKKIVHAGAAGNGQAAKICNNLILGITMIAVSEGFTLAEKLGLDTKTFYDISSNASGACWSMINNCPAPNVLDDVPSSHDYQPGFMAKMMLKDLRLANTAAEVAEAKIPLGKNATQLYEQFVNNGNGDKDFSAIIKLIE